jgi:hypothetical protein
MQMRYPSRLRREGFAVVTVLLLAVVLMALLAAMFALTNVEIASSRTNADITSGFYAAEAGLNVRGEQIRSEFQGYVRPSGTSPDELDACAGTNVGTGDFRCQTQAYNQRTVTTYVLEDARNNDPNDADRTITIPPGELFAGLSAIQYRYSVLSEAVPPNETRPEAILEMTFRVRLVPMFQFAAFYDKDLEIGPGPSMTLDGRVHANGDIYLNTGNTLRINGQVTAAVRSGGTGGNVHRGGKAVDGRCRPTVLVESLVAGVAPELACQEGSSFTPVPQSALEPFQGQIRTGLDTLTVPPPAEFDPAGLYWQQADVRVALDLRSGLENARVVALRPDTVGGIPQEDAILTGHLEACLAADADDRGYGVRPHTGITGTPTPRDPASAAVFGGDVRAVEWSNSFRDRWENRADANARNAYRLMLEVDVAGLLDCLHDERTDFFVGRPAGQDGIDSVRNGGLVWFFTVLGADETAASSGYGVRLRNADALAATASGAPDINGLTIVSDQAVFTSGHYNRTDWRPAAVLADTIHVLSGARVAANGRYTTDAATPRVLSQRAAVDTTVNAAFLANTDTTGGADGVGGQGGAYNGGLENYPRFHETWSWRTLNYAGSFVSLGEPLRSTGTWPGTGGSVGVYDPPVRAWSYDTRFNDVANLPPLTPRFVYLVLERFIREFDR